MLALALNTPSFGTAIPDNSLGRILYASQDMAAPKVEVGDHNPNPSPETQSELIERTQSYSGANSFKHPHVVKVESRPDSRVSQWEKIMQSFIGRVVHVSADDNEFTAIISDRTNISMPDEVIVISYDHVMPSDKILISEGAVFFWNIGRYREWNLSSRKLGPSVNHFEIRFRRLPPITAEKAQEIQQASKIKASRIHAD